MNLKGQKVIHKVFGTGTVVEMTDDDHFKVKFPSKESDFQYPQAFEKFLTAEDDKIQAEITKELDEKKAAKEAEKAAKLAAMQANLVSSTSKTQKGGSSDKPYVPVKREEGQVFTFIVFQGGTFKEESEGQYIWAPKYDSNGRSLHYWESLTDVREGDIIISVDHKKIKAVSRAKGPCVECARPTEYSDDVDGNWSKEGRKVECEYTIIKKPVKTSDFREEILDSNNKEKYLPFDKEGGGNLGYLYHLKPELASIFLKASADNNPELLDLEYIKWLL